MSTIERNNSVRRTRRVTMACELYCCLLPQCEVLRTCRSGFPIATMVISMFIGISNCLEDSRPGAEPDIFIWGGPLEGPVLQQGELSMVCVGLSERDLKNFGGHWGGRQNFGGQWPPWYPSSSAPAVGLYFLSKNVVLPKKKVFTSKQQFLL